MFKRWGMRKGQSAMEFLVTYGWAILIILSVVAVLGYYFMPKIMFGADMCVLGDGFVCDQFQVTRSHIRINLVNNLGYDIEPNTEFTLSCDSKDPMYYPDHVLYEKTSVFEDGWNSGEDVWFYFPPVDEEAQRLSCDIHVAYTKEKSSYRKRASGELKWRHISQQGTAPAEDCSNGIDDDFDGCGDNTDVDCGHLEKDLGTGACDDDIDNNCDGGVDCNIYSGDSSCMAYGFCNFDPLCSNDMLDMPDESDWDPGPGPDCGRLESGCPFCQSGQHCFGDEYCANDECCDCDSGNDVCADGGSPIIMKQPVVCPQNC